MKLKIKKSSTEKPRKTIKNKEGLKRKKSI